MAVFEVQIMPISKRLSLILIIVFYLIHSGFIEDQAIRAEVQSFSAQTKHFLNHLQKASIDECAGIFNQYNGIISSSLDLTKVYFEQATGQA